MQDEQVLPHPASEKTVAGVSGRGQVRSRWMFAVLLMLAAVAAVAGAAMLVLGVGRGLVRGDPDDDPSKLPSFSEPEFSPDVTIDDLKSAAKRVVEELHAAYPESLHTWNVEALRHFHFGSTTEAGQLWQRCLTQDPKYGDAYYGLGYIAQKNGEHDKAVELFQKVMQLAPADKRAPYLIADSLVSINRPREAIQILSGYLEASSRVPVGVLACLGQAYYSLDDFDNARAVYQRALQLAPDHRKAHYGLFLTYRKLGDSARAEQHLQEFRRLSKQQRTANIDRLVNYDDLSVVREIVVMLHNEAGKAYLALGSPLKAEDMWLRAGALEPRDGQSRTQLLGLYENAGKNRKALYVCQQLRDLDPENADYWHNLGVLLAHLGKTDEALAAVKHALELAPDNPGYRKTYEVIRRGS